MIIGKIEDGLHPRISLEIAGTKGSEILSMLVDTGFDMDAALHYDFADEFGWEIYGVAEFDYANGQSDEELLCRAQVNWHGQWQEIDVVLSADEEPAIGTRLLKGCVMAMNFIEDTLTIDKPVHQ